MTVYAHTDGAARGNPGEGGIGVIMRSESGDIVYSCGGYIGRATNNAAEYQALLVCLKKASEIGCDRLIVHSDSQLMVRQLMGEYRVKDKHLAKYYQEAMRIIRSAPYEFRILHIDRSLNADADLLANTGIDTREPCPV